MAPLRTPLLDVLAGLEPERRPIWLMRQAGRYLPEYRETRAKAGSFLQLCYNPELACEVTLQPLRRYDLDAAILFSDILVVPHAMGADLSFHEGEGPRLSTVGSVSEVEALSDGHDAPQFRNVFETVRHVRAALKPSIGFIGFCGAPWTVASYMIEGRGSDRKMAVAVAVENPAWFALLLERLVATSIDYLCGQIAAGVQVVQVFDSWAGDIPSAHRERVVFGPIRRIIDGVRALYPAFPVIAFARGIGDEHGLAARQTDASAVGVEEGVSLRDVMGALPDGVAMQGNLAPAVLLESDETIGHAVRGVVAGVPMRRHIFNLGHGITPQVRTGAVDVLVAAVRAHDEANPHV
jgi:uroporphyrinogen decarboxylase